MIDITSHRQGAILNHNHGVETDSGLKIRVEGISETGRPVKINGVPAEMDGRIFRADVELKEQYNNIKASVLTPSGNYSQELTLVWDKKSFKRFNCYIDDHSFLFMELTRQKPARAFDHFYLAALKKIHDETGLKVTLNTFFRNDHDPDGYLLSEMPDIWKSEFEDQSDWLRFSFHSYSEFPDRPYLEASAEEFGKDYDLVQNEIIRFAGEKSFIVPMIIHWGNIHPVVAAEYRRRGSRYYGRSMRPMVMGGPSLAERQKGGDMKQVEKRASARDERVSPIEGFGLYYDDQEEISYLAKHKAYYNPALDMFIQLGTVCCNLTTQDVIRDRIAKQFEIAEKYGVEAFSFASHEQYSFPFYPNYIPDHLDRIALTARLFHDAGYKGVFYPEGIMGNTAWEA
ncbi:MAG: hypothetical protein IKB16_07465 [Lentisphaeria bacterium]|nr:hypothetical protein [Lentisphaeria bacterium]